MMRQSQLAVPDQNLARRTLVNRLRSCPPATAPLPAADEAPIRAALAALLATKQFYQATRMRQLLCYLVEQTIAGRRQEAGEYAIAMEVFGRDPATFHPGSDPIVRIQIGRLRRRLETCYRTRRAPGGGRFSIPPGSYLPVFSLEAEDTAPVLLVLEPFRAITPERKTEQFAQGLNEEMAFELFRELGPALVSRSLDADALAASHRLEGSVRTAGPTVRVSVRLVDCGEGRILWSAQFDRNAPYTIDVQEALAQAIGRALRQHFPPA